MLEHRRNKKFYYAATDRGNAKEKSFCFLDNFESTKLQIVDAWHDLPTDFLETPVLRFALLPYYRLFIKLIDISDIRLFCISCQKNNHNQSGYFNQYYQNSVLSFLLVLFVCPKKL